PFHALRELHQDLASLNRVAHADIDPRNLAGTRRRDHRLHFHGLEDQQRIVRLNGLPELGRDADDHARDGTAANLALIGHGCGGRGSLPRRRGAWCRSGDAGLRRGRDVTGVWRLLLRDFHVYLVHLVVHGNLELHGWLLAWWTATACDA